MCKEMDDMDEERVRVQLVEVLQTIQRESGYGEVSLAGDTCPLDDLEGFDSKIAPVAITLLTQATGISIPNRKNIFVGRDGRQHLTVDQIVHDVCNVAREKVRVR